MAADYSISESEGAARDNEPTSDIYRSIDTEVSRSRDCSSAWKYSDYQLKFSYRIARSRLSVGGCISRFADTISGLQTFPNEYKGSDKVSQLWLLLSEHAVRLQESCTAR